MAEAKKRKTAPEPAVVAKKTKISKDDAAATKTKPAPKKTASRTIVKSVPEPATIKETKRPRKRAEDLIEQPDETPVVEEKTEAAPGKVKKTKTTTASQPTADGVVETKKTVTTAKATKAKTTKAKATNADIPKQEQPNEKAPKATGPKDKVTKGKSAKAAAKEVVAAEEDFGGFSSSDDAADDKIDDQTAALLAGFESSEDENDPEDEAGIALDKIPAIPNSKEMKKQLVAAQTTDDETTPGVVYVGRIPHGFFEHQMRAYFAQFGEITHLRLSRNKLTGKSKHYAFIEFSSAAVADIVAKTMDKYLMFNHILQVRRVPAEQVHVDLWKGEGKRFKAMPRNKIEGGLLKRGASRDIWEKRVQKESKKRTKAGEKLKEMGYEFEMPVLKSVDEVPVKEMDKEGLAITAAVEEVAGEAAVLAATEAALEEGATKAAEEEAPEDAAAVEATAVKRKKTAKEPKKAKKARKSL